MKPSLFTLSALSMLVSANALAAEIREFTPRCEEALALSALPTALRERANVYVWRDGDFEQTIDNGGDLHCLVERGHPDSIIPECITASGKDSIFKRIVMQTQMSAAGMSAEAVAERIEALVASGEIGTPAMPGVNYMMSAYNHIFSADADGIIEVPPHTMFFAPNATNAAVGGSLSMAQETKGFPYVFEGGAHSYIVTFTDKSSDSGDVERYCAGEVDLRSTVQGGD